MPAGKYKVECYGGQGGPSLRTAVFSENGGKGAYASGIMTVEGKGRSFYVYVGGIWEQEN